MQHVYIKLELEEEKRSKFVMCCERREHANGVNPHEDKHDKRIDRAKIPAKTPRLLTRLLVRYLAAAGLAFC